jgi:hypothetical protein
MEYADRILAVETLRGDSKDKPEHVLSVPDVSISPRLIC